LGDKHPTLTNIRDYKNLLCAATNSVELLTSSSLDNQAAILADILDVA
jgi:hypothetical protein